MSVSKKSVSVLVFVLTLSAVSTPAQAVALFLANFGTGQAVKGGPVGMVLGGYSLFLALPIGMAGGGVIAFNPLLGLGLLLDSSAEEIKALSDKVASYGASEEEAQNLGVLFYNAAVTEKKNGSASISIEQIQENAPEFVQTPGFGQMLKDMSGVR